MEPELRQNTTFVVPWGCIFHNYKADILINDSIIGLRAKYLLHELINVLTETVSVAWYHSGVTCFVPIFTMMRSGYCRLTSAVPVSKMHVSLFMKV